MGYIYENIRNRDYLSPRVYYREKGTPQCRYPLHWHEDYEFDLVINGAINAVVGGKNIRVEKGDFLFIDSGIMHETDAENEDEMEAVTVIVPFTLLKTYCRDVETRKFSFENRPEAAEKIKNLLYECGRAAREKADFCRVEFDIFSREIALVMLRECMTEPDGIYVSPDYLAPVRSAMAYIEENYRNDISLHDAAAEAGMSDTYFSKYFRKVTGQNFRDYLNVIRLYHAYSVLSAGNVPVSVIADDCGFASVKAFINAFNKYYGSTPGKYRRNFHEN